MLSLRMLFAKLYTAFIDLLSPPCCAYCKEFILEREIFCSSCMDRLQPVVTIMMPITTTKSVKVFAAAAYKEPIKTLVVAKSWSDHIAATNLGQLIWERTDIVNLPCDFLVPVPLHWSRFAKRGFNQAQEIADVIAQKNGAQVIDILKRSKRTPFQSGLKSSERIANVHDAFVLKNIDIGLYKDKHIIIVDDLLTTGATIRSVAKELFKLQPASITIVVACRVAG